MASNIHIVNSYKVSKHRFESVLATFTDADAQVVKMNRSMRSLCAEWSVHNFLYRIGIERERTASVDLDYPCDKPEWLYCLFGAISWLFIE